MRSAVKYCCGALLLLLIAVPFGLWVWQHLEYVESRQILRSRHYLPPYLAAERFLQQQGVDVTQPGSLPGPNDPAQGTTLLLLRDRTQMRQDEVDALLRWTAHGGHLLVVAEALWDPQRQRSDDLLLNALGVRQYTTGFAGEDKDRLTQLHLDGIEQPMLIDFDPSFHLVARQGSVLARAGSAYGTHLLQLRWQAGRVTVMTDPYIWGNDAIARHDNAWLLWYLTRDTRVSLIAAPPDEGLFPLLRPYLPALILLGLCLALLIWRSAARSGPLLPEPSPARRQWVEHLRAIATFQARHHGRAHLLLGLRDDLLRLARQRIPGFARLDPSEQRQQLALIARLPVSEVERLLQPAPRQRLSAAEFTQRVTALQTLRNAL